MDIGIVYIQFLIIHFLVNIFNYNTVKYIGIYQFLTKEIFDGAITFQPQFNIISSSKCESENIFNSNMHNVLSGQILYM